MIQFKIVEEFRFTSSRMLNMIKNKKNLEFVAIVTRKFFKTNSKVNVVEAFFIV